MYVQIFANLSSEVGDIRGVPVGVTDPGLKNVSMPSPRSSIKSEGRNIGLVGARVFARRGLPFTRCCNCCPAGSSATESNDSADCEQN